MTLTTADQLRLSYSLTRATQSDTNPPKRAKKRVRVKDMSTGNYLTYDGESMWLSKVTAKKQIINSLWNVEFESRGRNADVHQITQFVNDEIKRGRIVFEQVDAP
jgi:hypothetical protein